MMVVYVAIVGHVLFTLISSGKRRIQFEYDLKSLKNRGSGGTIYLPYLAQRPPSLPGTTPYSLATQKGTL